MELYNQAKVVPIIDDFYKVNNKGKIIEILSRYKSCIVVVDDFIIFRYSERKHISWI